MGGEEVRHVWDELRPIWINRLNWIMLSVFSFIMIVSCSTSKVDTTSIKKEKALIYNVDVTTTYQTIHNFGASDAWSIQFVGSEWPDASRKQMSEWLFSTETTADGQPKGIGLSAWRFNIGAGSAEQGAASKIQDDWRRTECFLKSDGSYDWTKQSGQLWFLEEARRNGVNDIIGFVNSPPVYFTKNGKAWADNAVITNLSQDHYEDYATFLANVIAGVKAKSGVQLDFISPFNEPQWGWECCGQEGSPWSNDELAKVTKIIDRVFSEKGISETEIEITDAGQIDYLYDPKKAPLERGNQIREFFDLASDNYLGSLDVLSKKVTGHSYFSTWDQNNMVNSRLELKKTINEIDQELEYWVSEYCLLEDNEKIKGNGKDLGIDPAIYMARVIHADLYYANASAWHWWLAVSPYDYKDGLIYIDKNNKEKLEDSKLLWALGNYSAFIKSGSKRVAVERENAQDGENLLVSAYLTPAKEVVVVCINDQQMNQEIVLSGLSKSFKKMNIYQTSGKPEDNLRFVKEKKCNDSVQIPAMSIVTCVIR
jgi:O-glycosyl hydrolase